MADLTTRNDGALQKVTISTTEVSGLKALTALINPKEITIAKAIAWSKHPKSLSDEPTMEFTGAADPKTLDLELLFDSYEADSAISVYDECIAVLENYATIDPDLERPPICEVTWGKWKKVFKGVIANISVKYTMFLPEGVPVRATATVKFTQAETAVKKGGAASASSTTNKGANKQAGQRMDQLAKLFNQSPRELAKANKLESMDVPAGTNVSGSK